MGRRLVVAVLLSLVGSGSALRCQQSFDYVDQKRRLAAVHVDSMVSDWLRGTEVPGAVVAIVDGSETLFLQGYGFADLETGAVVDPAATVFGVGELARPLVAAATLQLVDRRALDLDTDVNRYLTQLAIERRFDRPITARDLLTHTAGFDHRILGSRTPDRQALLPLSDYLRQRLPPRVRPPALVSLPSSHGYALAGLLIEELSGLLLPDYLHRHLFDPLAMRASRAGDASRPGPEAATAYRWLRGRNSPTRSDFPSSGSVSSLWTTGDDMSRWLRMLLNEGVYEGHRVLTPASLQQMLSRQFTSHELLPGRTLAFQEGARYSPRELFEVAGGQGFSAVTILLPHRRLGLFVACNREVDLWSLVHRIVDLFEAPATATPMPALSLPRDALRPLVGFWREASVSHTTVEKLVTLVRQERIGLATDGALAWRSRPFHAIAPRAFQEVNGLRRVAFLPSGEPRIATTGEVVLEKLSRYESLPVQAGLWLTFATVFLASGWARSPLPRARRGLRPEDAVSPRWPALLARIAAILHFVFIVLLFVLLAGVAIRGARPLLYGAPLPLLLLLTLPLAAAACTAVAATGLAVAWTHRCWALRLRVRLTLLVIVLVAFLPFLDGWRLLGFRL